MQFPKDHLPGSKCFQLWLLKFSLSLFLPSFLLSLSFSLSSKFKFCKYWVLVVIPNKTHQSQNIGWFYNSVEVKLKVYLYNSRSVLKNDSAVQSKHHWAAWAQRLIYALSYSSKDS